MNKILPLIAFCLAFCSVQAQDSIDELHENAKLFMRKGDYANAGVILVRAMEQEPDNLALAKDLAFNYYLQKNTDKAAQVLAPFLAKNNADDQAYQIAGLIYRAASNVKESEKVYKKGIKTFPKSGPLYNDYGEFLQQLNDANAIKYWEKGIEEDPAFGSNYYNAAKYYSQTKDKVWGLIYGEIFINTESFTARTTEMKNILFQGYKRLYSETDLLKDTKSRNQFERLYLAAMNKQNDVVKYGIDVETLTMVRTRFILEWFKNGVAELPFELFDYHNRLLTEGLFPAYNQWLFGPVQSLSGYQNWTQTHKQAYDDFNKFQKNNLFKMPENQYYH